MMRGEFELGSQSKNLGGFFRVRQWKYKLGVGGDLLKQLATAPVL